MDCMVAVKCREFVSNGHYADKEAAAASRSLLSARAAHAPHMGFRAGCVFQKLFGCYLWVRHKKGGKRLGKVLVLPFVVVVLVFCIDFAKYCGHI